MTAEPANPRESRSRRGWRIAGFAIGVLLIAAAARAVWSRAGELQQVRESLGAESPARLLLLAVLPLASWLLTSGVFWCLTRPRAKVGAGEMAALVGGAWLLNYLPLSPGLLGRVAYQKAALGVPVRTSARIVVESIALGLCGGGLLLCEQIVSARMGKPGAIGLSLLLLALLSAGLFRKGVVGPLIPAYACALVLKYVDTLAWALRYWMVFSVLGAPLTSTQAIAIALVAQVSMLVPGLANGLGLREWVVGVLAASLPTWFLIDPHPAAGAATVPLALAADMALRLSEVAMAVPVGLASAIYLSKRRSLPR
ncbi:hypothetical protein PHYC_02105 [Phycisphaerales bacterium]|nr:hypothetical protein PHYC_02105 [Phycisphaerales bacterium]